MGIKIIADNKKARFEYFVEDSLEAGIVLLGSEVKSVRLGQISLSESYCHMDGGELILKNCHIAPYKMGTLTMSDALRDRKLLLHKAQILKLETKVKQKGFTIIPLKIYLKEGLVKLEVGLCRGKKLHDKRDSIKEKDIKRLVDRDLKNFK